VYINPFAESFSLLFFDRHYSHTRNSNIISPARENWSVGEEREIFYLLCGNVIGIAATPAMCISSEKFLMREMKSVLLNDVVNCKDYTVSVGRGIK
jgi:hypothetical protein